MGSSSRRPRWVPKEPGYTCPAIDRVQRMVRRYSEEIGDAGVAEICEALEEVRKENTEVRAWGVDVIDAATSEIEGRESTIETLQEEVRQHAT